jgi:hypothetical protein
MNNIFGTGQSDPFYCTCNQCSGSVTKSHGTDQYLLTRRHSDDGDNCSILMCLLLRVNSHDEKVAMNEVFAHAALIKHKHVVRYYNSGAGQSSLHQCCGSGAFLAPRSGMGKNSGSMIRDEHPRRFFRELTNNFWG